NLYRGWGAILGPFEVGAVVSTWALVPLARGRRGLLLTLTAAVLLTAVLAAFFALVRPINVAVAAWTPQTLPADWPAYRLQWRSVTRCAPCSAPLRAARSSVPPSARRSASACGDRRSAPPAPPRRHRAVDLPALHPLADRRALVVELLPDAESELRLRPPARPVEAQRHEGQAPLLDPAPQTLDLLAVQQQLPVPLVDEHDLRLVRTRRRLLHPGERRGDHQVAGPDEMRGGAVHADDAAVGRALDGVGLEAIAVGRVPHPDGLVRQEVGGVHQPPVDRDRALVVDVGLGHGGPMDLGPQHLARPGGIHGTSPSGTSSRLSISLTPPTHTATASSAAPATSATSPSVSGSLSSAYSSRARRSPAITAVARATTGPALRSPANTSSAAASSARGTQRAASRSSGARRRLRLESARPSGSRTVATPTISIPKMDTTTRCARWRAAATSARCPAWSAPIVGTRPIRRPAPRSASAHACMARGSVSVVMRLPSTSSAGRRPAPRWGTSRPSPRARTSRPRAPPPGRAPRSAWRSAASSPSTGRGGHGAPAPGRRSARRHRCRWWGS